MALSGVLWCARLSSHAHDGTNRIGPVRSAAAAHQNHSGRAMARYVGARGVDNVGQIDSVLEEGRDELAAELALHERVCRDLTDEPGASTVGLWLLGQFE